MRRLPSMLPAVLVISAAAASERPNVVLFYADDMGIGDLGCYGCTDIRTPGLDALAGAGVRFTNYYSAAPVCSASRAALMTGRCPVRVGVPGNCSSTPGEAGLSADEVTVAELARARGYATALIGKWHLGFSPDTQPNAQGFDYFFGHHAGCIDYYSHMFYWQAPHHHDLYRNREEVHEEGQYMTDLIVREAGRFIDTRREGPFLMYVAFNAPHYPLQAPERFRRMYAHLPPPRRDYAPLVAAMDDAVGQIVDRLRARGLLDRTLIFFASDNGPSAEARANYGGGSSGPFRGRKFSLWEGGIRMPGIVSWPGRVPKGQVREQLAIAMDLLPTVAAAIGATVPADRRIDGRSWMPLLSDPAAAGHEALFWLNDGQGAVRRGRWKAVFSVRDGARGQPVSRPAEDVFLADLETDPGERRSLASEHPEIVKNLAALHTAWRASVRDK